MKVLLKKDVDNLGYAGEVLDVADGYGRNYLIPRGVAVRATAGVLKEARAWRERATARMAELRREHEALAARIQETHLVFTARAGETGKLYGSVTMADVIEELNRQLGTDIDRRLATGNPLRQLGEHQVTIKLSRDYHPQVVVFIHPESDQEPVAEAEGLEAEGLGAEGPEAEGLEAEGLEAEGPEAEGAEALETGVAELEEWAAEGDESGDTDDETEDV
jgi:large subunit ribosomal protein L9